MAASYPEVTVCNNRVSANEGQEKYGHKRLLVSVLLSVRNGENVIKDCLDSVVTQTYRPMEIICVNDASQDKTEDIINQWQGGHKEIAVIIIKNKVNLGLTKSLNIGSQQVNGSYIARIDADDVWLPEKISKQIDWLEKNPEVGVIGSNYANIKGKKQQRWHLPVEDKDIRRTIFRHNPFGHSCVVMRTELFRSVNGYNNKIKYSQDRDLWFRLLEKTKFHNIGEILCIRRADTGLSVAQSRTQMAQSIRTTLFYIWRYKANIINIFFLAVPAAIALTPNSIKRLYQLIAYRQPTGWNDEKINLIYINDCFLPSAYANAVARLAMAEAFANHNHIGNIRFYYHARTRNITTVENIPQIQERQLRANYLPRTNILARYLNPIIFIFSSARLLFIPIPRSYPVIYTRVGALIGFMVGLRMILQPRVLIFELHNFEFGRNKFIDILYKFIFKRCSLLVTVARTTKDNWLDHGMPSEKILVIPSGVFLERYNLNKPKEEIRESLGLPKNKYLIMYGGNLYKQRGLEDILSAAQRLENKNDLYFIIVGGQQRDVDYYQKWRRERNYQGKNVTFVGCQRFERMPYYLKSADLLLVTYSQFCQTVNSMSPMKLIEALAARVPVVAPKLPRILDIANQEMVTWYEPDNTESLLDAINYVIANPGDAQKKCQRGYEVAKYLSWGRRADKILEHALVTVHK